MSQYAQGYVQNPSNGQVIVTSEPLEEGDYEVQFILSSNSANGRSAFAVLATSLKIVVGILEQAGGLIKADFAGHLGEGHELQVVSQNADPRIVGATIQWTKLS